jgi:hypothetical protein
VRIRGLLGLACCSVFKSAVVDVAKAYTAVAGPIALKCCGRLDLADFDSWAVRFGSGAFGGPRRIVQRWRTVLNGNRLRPANALSRAGRLRSTRF